MFQWLKPQPLEGIIFQLLDKKYLPIMLQLQDLLELYLCSLNFITHKTNMDSIPILFQKESMLICMILSLQYLKNQKIKLLNQ